MDYKESETNFQTKNQEKLHPKCVICEGVCVCEQTYIGKTGRKVEL